MKRFLFLLAAVWIVLALAWADDATAEEPRPIGRATVSVRHGDLNGRQSPDVHSQKVAWFQNGDVIDVYEIDGEWALTDGGEYGTCWVNIGFLTTEDAGTYTVTANGRVRVRKTPDGDAVGWLRPGQQVDVLCVVGGWARTGKGWVMAEYMERRDD